MSSDTNGDKSTNWIGIILGVLFALTIGLAIGYMVNEYQYNQAINDSIDAVNESIDSVNQSIKENEAQRQSERESQQVPAPPSAEDQQPITDTNPPSTDN